jgi:hypothetical protein
MLRENRSALLFQCCVVQILRGDSCALLFQCCVVELLSGEKSALLLFQYYRVVILSGEMMITPTNRVRSLSWPQFFLYIQ